MSCNPVISQSNKVGLYYYKDWISSLTINPWEIGEGGFVKNLFCTSERQALVYIMFVEDIFEI